VISPRRPVPIPGGRFQVLRLITSTSEAVSSQPLRVSVAVDSVVVNEKARVPTWGVRKDEQAERVCQLVTGSRMPSGHRCAPARDALLIHGNLGGTCNESCTAKPATRS
jgi:hypothetical protein